MCCERLTRATLNDLFHVPHPSFVIPIFRAPTTLSTTIATTTTTKIISTILKHEEIFSPTSPQTSPMINQQTFENLILTNTIVAAFCIVLMITLTGFLLFLLIPSIRRRWLNGKSSKETLKTDEISPISPQPSFHHFTLGPSRLNPIFEPTPGTSTAATTTTTTQFGTLFHPTTTATTLLHPTFWTPLTPTSLLSTTPAPSQQYQHPPTPPSASVRQHFPMNSSSSSLQQQQQQIQPSTPTLSSNPGKPPLPSHPPTTSSRSMRKR